MGDLKPIWQNIPVPDVGLEGDGITARGGDPNITIDSPDGLKEIWTAAPVADIGGMETSNSVSGLPTLPNRWEPTGTPPPPPDLTDRNPGTIDQQ